MANYTAVLNRFINSDEFAEAIINSTKTKEAYSGSYYMVELLSDESWRVIWFKEADTSPVTTTRLIIPQLTTEEYQELKEEVGSGDTVKMADVLRKNDIINKKADILRSILHL